MHGDRLRTGLAALVILLAATDAALAQSPPPTAAASTHAQFPQLPLKRDTVAGASVADSLGWAALLVLGVAAGGFLIARRRTSARLGHGAGWLRPPIKPWTPKPLGRTLLTQQASLHVIEWRGEELLLGCTAHAVSVLGRRPCDAAGGTAPQAGEAKELG